MKAAPRPAGLDLRQVQPRNSLRLLSPIPIAVIRPVLTQRSSTRFMKGVPGRFVRAWGVGASERSGGTKLGVSPALAPWLRGSRMT